MEAIVQRGCGLDVHQASVVACVLVGDMATKPRKQVRTFGTTRRELIALREWLASEQCTHVAMESTGVYWMPIYVALEGHFELVVGNATHIQNVPGRKTDVKDSEWIAALLRHGLIRKSLVPPPPIRALRELTRYRRKLVDAQTAERNRLLRLLATADIKLAGVATNVLGVSGRLMLHALVDGTQTPEEMAHLAKGALRKKLQPLAEALAGQLTDDQRFVLRIQLERLAQVEQSIAHLDARIDERLQPYAEEHRRLMQIPGVDRVGAAIIIAELGVDMSVFPTAQHAAAWAGVCPGNNESAGRHKHRPHRKGNVHLTTALVQAAVCGSKTKGSYLKAKYWQLRARRGAQRAAVAIAHRILLAAYHMLAHKDDYRDLGADYLDRKAAAKRKAHLVRGLEALGYRVTLEQTAA